MMHRFYLYAQTVWPLICADLIVFKQNVKNRIIDNFIVFGLTILVMGYILPQLGITADYDLFMLATLIMNTTQFDTYPLVAALVSDVAGGEKRISYELLLPMPSWCVFVRIIISALITNMFFVVTVLPVLFFYVPRIGFENISFINFLMILVMSSLFSPVFALITASFIKNMQGLSTVWCRFVYPMWFLGGFQFTWHAMYSVFPVLAYINLLNPLLYTYEGARAALFGAHGLQGPHIPIFICVPVLLVLTIIIACIAIMRFKKRLDFV